MPYQPGPLILQTLTKVGFEKKVYDFAGDVHDQLGDLETIPAGWTDFLDDVTQLMAESSDPFPDVNIDEAMLTMASYPEPDYPLGVNALVTALGTANAGLANAIGFAPAESWMDSPGGFVPPSPAETLGVPVIPPNSIIVKVTGTVGDTGNGAATGGGLQGPMVTLINTSQYGNANFRVGDQFQVTATGVQGQTVYAYATLNGSDLGGGPMGDIGGDGKLVITGSMAEEHIGIWTEQWWVGSTHVADFAFVVVGN